MNEVCIDQQYEVIIDGKTEVFTIDNIRATNVDSKYSYLIAVTFKNENQTFDTNVENVIEGKYYKLIL